MSDLCAASCTPCDSAATDVYVMEGHNIISDTINELINNHAIDTASDLILSGCSAGGLGTFENTDFVQSLLPNVRVVGNPQAGYFGTEFITFPKFVELGRDACSAGHPIATSPTVRNADPGLDYLQAQGDALGPPPPPTACSPDGLSPSTAGCLWNSQIAPLTSLPTAAWLWYQGAA